MPNTDQTLRELRKRLNNPEYRDFFPAIRLMIEEVEHPGSVDFEELSRVCYDCKLAHNMNLLAIALTNRSAMAVLSNHELIMRSYREDYY